MHHGLLLSQKKKKLIDALVLNFKAIFSARVKVREKDFCIVLCSFGWKTADELLQSITDYSYHIKSTKFAFSHQFLESSLVCHSFKVKLPSRQLGPQIEPEFTSATVYATCSNYSTALKIKKFWR